MSQRGCQPCLNRFVKCVLDGPPCSNCVKLNTGNSCYYDLGVAHQQFLANSQPQSSSCDGKELGNANSQELKITFEINDSGSSERAAKRKANQEASQRYRKKVRSTGSDPRKSS